MTSVQPLSSLMWFSQDLEGQLFENSGLHYYDLPQSIKTVFLNKIFQMYFKKKYISQIGTQTMRKVISNLTYTSVDFSIRFFGVFSLGVLGTSANSYRSLGLYGAKLLKLFLIFQFCLREKRKFVKAKESALVSKMAIKELFYLIESHDVRKLDCSQFSVAVRHFPHHISLLDQGSEITKQQHYLFVKIPLIILVSKKKFLKIYYEWDLYAEIKRHPILLEALKLNLREELKRDQEIDLILKRLEFEDMKLSPPPIPKRVVNFNSGEIKTWKQINLESVIPDELVFRNVSYYLENIQKIRVESLYTYDLIANKNLLPKDNFILNDWIEQKMLALSKAIFYSDYPTWTQKNVNLFLEIFGLAQYEKLVIELFKREFKIKLKDKPNLAMLNRLLKLVPIMEHYGEKKNVFKLKKIVNKTLMDDLEKCWKFAHQNNLDFIKKEIFGFCSVYPEITEASWLAVPREIRNAGFERLSSSRSFYSFNELKNL